MSLQSVVDEVYGRLASRRGEGRVANYIPALARIDPKKFGIAAVGIDGEVARAGDADEPFSIQSVSKVFVLTLALGQIGNGLWKRVGREPSGSAFNSIVQLEHEHGIPRNPLINAGAIAVCDVVVSHQGAPAAKAMILSFLRDLACDDSVAIDLEVARSEAATGFRNASLANFMKSFAVIDNPVTDVLDVYFNQCAIAMSCTQLARAGLFLAARGRDPLLNRKIVREVRARRINAIMMSCGHYDASGDFAFRVGLPGKSGVGGGILCISPGEASIAVWSPGLNEQGNSALGTAAMEEIAKATNWSVFD